MVLVQKRPFFKLFFLGNLGQENVFYDILEQENAFLGYENKKFKNCHSNCHGFGPKMAIFQTVFFLQFRPRKCLLQYSRMKNGFLGYKNKKFKNWHFAKGLTNGFGPKRAIFLTFFFFRQYRPGKCLWRYSGTKKRLCRA